MADSAEAKVKEIIINELGVDPEKVTAEASFVEDLGADSLDTVELVMAFEEEFGVDIPDEDAEQMRTVGDAITYLKEHMEEGLRGPLSAFHRKGGKYVDGESRPRAPGRHHRGRASSRRSETTGGATWKALLAGTSGAGTITQFDATEEYATRIACEVKGFDPSRVPGGEGGRSETTGSSSSPSPWPRRPWPAAGLGSPRPGRSCARNASG